MRTKTATINYGEAYARKGDSLNIPIYGDGVVTVIDARSVGDEIRYSYVIVSQPEPSPKVTG